MDMKLRQFLAATALLSVGIFALPAGLFGQAAANETERTATARANVGDLIRQSGKDVAVAFRTLDGNQEIFINADERFPATSQWVEIPVMIELRAEAQARTLKLDDTLVVQNEFRSAADGSEYRLDPARDPDKELYKQLGRRMSLGDLETRMMKHDSHLATNLLIEFLGIGRIEARLAELRASGIQLKHGFQDLKAQRAGDRNSVTARGMMEVLWSLATDKAISADASKEMIGLLANSRTATAAPFAAGGQRSDTSANDAQEAIVVYGAHSYALAVVVKGQTSSAASAALISKISHELSAAN
jgi:beta-lactamase class A